MSDRQNVVEQAPLSSLLPLSDPSKLPAKKDWMQGRREIIIPVDHLLSAMVSFYPHLQMRKTETLTVVE